MDWWLASFFLGAIFSLFLPLVPDIFVLFSLLLFSVTFFYYPYKLNKAFKPLRISSGLLLGATWMLFNAYNYQQLWQENNLNAKDLSSQAQWIKGEIISLHSPLKNEKSQFDSSSVAHKRLRFNLKATHINDVQLKKSIQFRLSWKSARLALKQGQKVNLKVKFKPSHGLANLGSFSYQTWLNSKRISATGYVVNHKNNQVLMLDTSLRQQLFSKYESILPEHVLSPILLALGFGSRSSLTQDLWEVLKRTGTGHLIAISGLHIGLVASGCFFIVMFLTRIIPLNFSVNRYKCQTINIRYYAIGISIIIAFAYGYLAGFSLTTTRALVMLSIYWFIRLLAIHISIKRWLLMTLFVIVLITPFSLISASFWLSVYAVTVIFLTLWRFKGIISTGNQLWRFVKGLMVIQISLTFMLLPINAIFFQQISIVGFLANIIAVPWMSFISIPLCLLSVFFSSISETLSQFFIMLTIESVQILWHYLSYLSGKSWALLSLTNLNIQVLILLGLASILFVFFQLRLNYSYKSTTILFCCSFLIVLLSTYGRSFNAEKNSWQLVIFDVGQGLSILIQRENRAVLYDTGASYESGFNMIDSVVLPYLQHEGISKLDKVVISHGDNDHAGGLAKLKQSITIEELIYNSPKEDSSVPCLQGGTLNWQGINMKMLWPNKVVFEENDDSCVLLLSDGKHKVLLTGDISKRVELNLIQQYPELQVDVLVIPHHGSKTSSSKHFISQLKPSFAIVSAGFLNRWSMPVAEVVKRYHANNVQLINSGISGQIILNFSDKGIMKLTYHDHLWPFWFANTL